MGSIYPYAVAKLELHFMPQLDTLLVPRVWRGRRGQLELVSELASIALDSYYIRPRATVARMVIRSIGVPLSRLNFPDATSMVLADEVPHSELGPWPHVRFAPKPKSRGPGIIFALDPTRSEGLQDGEMSLRR